MNLLRWVCVSWCVYAALGSVSVRRAGWLERAASYYRHLFLNDVEDTAPVQLRATLVRAPGMKDEPGVWDYASVERMLMLLGASESSAPLRRALRRALRPSAPTRRFISKKESWKLFPSLGKKHANNIYYDFGSDESSSGEKNEVEEKFDGSDDAVLVLQNPVEARLPSARISVKLLRYILESRALAARAMPSTIKSTIPWVPMNKTSLTAGPAVKNETGFSDVTGSASVVTTDAGGATEAGADVTGDAAEPDANAEPNAEPEPTEAPQE